MNIIGKHVEHMGTHVSIDENNIDIIDNHACCFASGSCSLPLLKNKGGARALFKLHYTCRDGSGPGWVFVSARLSVCVSVIYIYIYVERDYICM